MAGATTSTKPAVATVFAEGSGKARGAATTTEPAAGTSAAAVLDAATTAAAVRAIATVVRDGAGEVFATSSAASSGTLSALAVVRSLPPCPPQV